MFEEFKALFNKKDLLKEDLLLVLKKYAKTISVFDLMEINSILLNDVKFVQKQYQKEFQEIYAKYFIGRIKDISEDKNSYLNSLNISKFKESVYVLEKQYNENIMTYGSSSKFPLLYPLISLYAIFILEEPIHPVGTPFPGSLKVEEKEGIYYCPVKESQKDTPNSVCNLCIAEQMDL